MKKIKEIWSNSEEVLFRYPMVMVMSLIASIFAVFIIDEKNQEDAYLGYRILILSTMGISLMFSIKMLSQRIGKQFLLEVLGVLFLVGYFFLFPKTENKMNEVHNYTIIITYILLHLLVSFVPFVNRIPENLFWQYNKNLFIKIFLTAIFTGVLVGGVELAILAVEKLFDLAFNILIYPRTIVFLAIFGSTFIFLLFIKNGLSDLEKDEDYPKILKFFTQFILIPLLFIYLVILYIYSGKILLSWELPRGWVSFLVIGYSILGIFALLLVHPLKDIRSKSWVKIFSKIFYFTVLPLLALLFISIFTRILEYGYTEPRYFVLIIAIWLAIVVLYYILIRNNTIKFIPISLFFIGVFALCFPYLNAFSIAKKSQLNQFNNILNKYKLLEKGKINFEKPISDSIVNELENKISYLTTRNEIEFLKPLVKDSLYNKIEELVYEGNYFTNIIRYEFKNIIYDDNNDKNKVYFYNTFRIISNNNFKKIDNFDYWIVLNYIEQQTKKLPNGDKFFLNFRKDNENKQMLLILNDKEKINLYPILKAFFPMTIEGEKEVPEIAISGEIGKYNFKIFFENLKKVKYNNDDEKIYYENGQLFLKIKE